MYLSGSPFTVFNDLQGNPLQSGYLYFGLVDQNPEISPVTVFWDQAGTQPALQPIRTISGYAVRNGSPALIYVSGDYSLTVRDRNKVLVYNSPEGNVGPLVQLGIELQNFEDLLASSAGADNIGYIQSGTASVATTVQKRLRYVLNVFDKMTTAQINDVIAGTATLDTQAAITQAIIEAGNKKLIIPAGLYLLNSKADVNAALIIPSNRYIEADGATFKMGSLLPLNIISILISDTTWLIGVQNVTIEGLSIDGNRGSRSTGSHSGMGFFISASRDVTLANIKSHNSTADGIEITGDNSFSGGLTKRVTLENIYCDNNYRNAISITGSQDVQGTNLLLTNTNGASPQTGLDLEPNGATSPNLNYQFTNVISKNNAGSGVSVYGTGSSYGKIVNLTSTGNTGFGYYQAGDSQKLILNGYTGGNNTGGDYGQDGRDQLALGPHAVIVANCTGSGTLLGGVNVSSAVSKLGTGVFTFSYNYPLPAGVYTIKGCQQEVGGSITSISLDPANPPTANTVTIKIRSGSSLVDCPYVSFEVSVITT